MPLRDPYQDENYDELRYWGTHHELCALIGCRGKWYARKVIEGCLRCGGGPFHRACLEKHLRWCTESAALRLVTTG